MSSLVDSLDPFINCVCCCCSDHDDGWIQFSVSKVGQIFFKSLFTSFYGYVWWLTRVLCLWRAYSCNLVYSRAFPFTHAPNAHTRTHAAYNGGGRKALKHDTTTIPSHPQTPRNTFTHARAPHTLFYSQKEKKGGRADRSRKFDKKGDSKSIIWID